MSDKRKTIATHKLGPLPPTTNDLISFFSQLAYLTPDTIAMHVGQSHSEAIDKSTKGMYSLLDVVFSEKSQEMLTRTTWDYQALAWVYQICYALYV